MSKNGSKINIDSVSLKNIIIDTHLNACAEMKGE